MTEIPQGVTIVGQSKGGGKKVLVICVFIVGGAILIMLMFKYPLLLAVVIFGVLVLLIKWLEKMRGKITWF